MRRQGMLLCGLLLCAFMAFAGGQTERATAPAAAAKKSDPVVLQFWEANAGPTRTPFHEELIRRFHEKNPNIKVEMLGLTVPTFKPKMDLAIASGDTPDCAEVQIFNVSEWSIPGALLALDDYFAKWNESSKFAASVIEGTKAAALDGKLYMLPTISKIDCLWYRKDLFKAAGIPDPTTWELFFSAVEKLTDKSRNQYGFSMRGAAGATLQLENAMYAYSGITNYFDDKGKCTINHPDHLEFLNKFVALYKKFTPEGDINNAYREMAAAYGSGTAAIIHHNLGSYAENLKALGPDKIAAITLPRTKTGKIGVGSLFIGGYTIPKKSKHPDESWAFMQSVASAENNSYWSENTGNIPARLEVLEAAWIKKVQHIQMASNALADKNAYVFNQPLYLVDYNPILNKILGPKWQAVMAGKLSTAEFLNDWAREFEKAREEFLKTKKK